MANRIILITGATSGFGKASAALFAADGDHLIITGRRADRLQEVATSLKEQYAVDVLPLVFDVQDKQACFDAIASLEGKWRNIDVLINNAGLALGRDLFQDADLQDWETMIDTNVKGLLYITKAVVPLMMERKSGHIINLGSIAGKEVYERGNVYCASKFAVDAISRSLRIDLLPYRIKVTSINPGAADTEFSKVRFKGDEQKANAMYVGYQPLVAEDVANVIHFAATLPPHVVINDLDITCIAQANSYYTFKG